MMRVAEGEATRAVRSAVLGTAGHIDHGKTALVRALTGTDTDRLPEEKSRGITIDLGFATLPLLGEDGAQIDVSIVDVPGHHAFVRNMLAGAGGVDCVMLIVAADDGVKPQTVEHLAICNLLGIEAGVVAITKCDLVSEERLACVRDDVRRLVEDTFLHGAEMVAVSSTTGKGLEALKAEIARVASRVRAGSVDRIARLPVDRCFSVRGFGTVVTGTLQGGAMRVGDAIELQPSGRTARVRGLQMHGRACEVAEAPCRVAVNLPGVDVGEVKRGEMVAPAHAISATGVIDVVLTALKDAELPRHRSLVRVHAFAAETSATVLYYEAPEPGQRDAMARLRLHRPIALVPGDRVVVRRLSPATTIGGGVVLDADPRPRRKAQTYTWLKQLQTADAEERMLLRVRRRGVLGISADELARELGLRKDAVGTMAALLVTSGKMVAGSGAHADWYIAEEAVQSATGKLMRELSESAASGMHKAEIQSKTGLQAWVVEIACRGLVDAKRVSVRGDVIALPERVMAREVPSEEMAVERAYREAGLASPLVNEVATRLSLGAAAMRAAVTSLLRSKRLVRLGADSLLVHAQALVELAEALRRHRGESFDVARFKAFTGLSRKHAIPLLEYLDGARVTRNVGGTRVVL